MSWLRIDDDFPEHTKVMALNGAAPKWLHVVALCQCAANLTDGHISRQRLKVVCAIADIPNPKKAVEQLVAAGLWQPEKDGYQIRDYLDYNPDAETVKAQREARSEAGRKGGTRSGITRNRQANREANTQAEAEAEAEANASQSASSKQASPPVEPRTRTRTHNSFLPSAAPHNQQAGRQNQITADRIDPHAQLAAITTATDDNINF